MSRKCKSGRHCVSLKLCLLLQISIIPQSFLGHRVDNKQHKFKSVARLYSHLFSYSTFGVPYLWLFPSCTGSYMFYSLSLVCASKRPRVKQKILITAPDAQNSKHAPSKSRG